MARIDPEHLLRAVTEDAPCGDNLEYDREYLELERALQPPAELMTGEADEDAPKGVDWADIRKRALALTDRTKDLRIVVPLTRALLWTDGVVGFRDGLALIRGLLDERWETVHPRLDPDDDNDPLLRVNTLVALNDADTVIRDLRAVPLVVSRNFGPVNYREIALAAGELTPIDGEAPRQMSELKAAFVDCDADALLMTGAAGRESVSLIAAIEQSLTEKVGASRAADFSAVRTAIRSISRFLDERVSERGLASAGAVDASGEVASAGQDASGGGLAGGGAVRQRPPDEVSSREDVVRLLEKLCDYFRRNEPSSPIPILLNRAKQLVGKDFMEILQDLAPDGVPQAERFKGASDAG